MVRRVRHGRVEAFEWTPADFGLDPAPADTLKADGPAASAAVIRGVLAGEDGPARRIVLANAAAALLVAGRAGSLPEGVARAEGAIDSGAARQLLAGLALSRA
jgi:anthranilate phosphoribosyltransferase